MFTQLNYMQLHDVENISSYISRELRETSIWEIEHTHHHTSYYTGEPKCKRLNLDCKFLICKQIIESFKLLPSCGCRISIRLLSSYFLLIALYVEE